MASLDSDHRSINGDKQALLAHSLKRIERKQGRFQSLPASCGKSITLA